MLGGSVLLVTVRLVYNCSIDKTEHIHCAYTKQRHTQSKSHSDG